MEHATCFCCIRNNYFEEDKEYQNNTILTTYTIIKYILEETRSFNYGVPITVFIRWYYQLSNLIYKVLVA